MIPNQRLVNANDLTQGKFPDVEWHFCFERMPTESDSYEVRATGAFGYVRKAYYDVLNKSWVYDDGVWLPVDITPYIVSWRVQKGVTL